MTSLPGKYFMLLGISNDNKKYVQSNMTQCMLVSFSGVCLFRNSYEIDAGCMCLKWR